MLFLIFAIIFFVLILVFRIIEPTYMVLFNKPLYLFFYPFPKKISSKQKQILENSCQFYKNLTTQKKVFFEHRVQRFLHKYQFFAKEDLEISDEIKIKIAATYVMLTFGMRNFLVEVFKTILIFPKAYYSAVNEQFHKGEFNPMLKVVAFSWEDFLKGLESNNDNINLGLHEFAHVLHFHCMKNNDPSAILFFDEFNKISQYFKDDKLLNDDYFRKYAFENKFEFIAVILEHFFETPREFKTKFPELFAHVSKMINFNEKNFVN